MSLMKTGHSQIWPIDHNSLPTPELGEEIRVLLNMFALIFWGH